jgi:hypothetical protein
LKWHPADEDSDVGVLELSLEAEQKIVEAQLEKEIQEGHKTRIKERWRLLREAARLLPEERVAECCTRTIRRNGAGVEIWCSSDSGHTFFGNLKCCASIWVCPVCAGKITEKRRVELQKALEEARILGLQVYMLTLTVPHHLGNDTRTVCDQLLHALKTMQNRCGWRKWTKRIGVKGSVRALEVTYGRNGPHPHIHMLLFCDTTQELLASDLLPHWKSACLSVGLEAPNEHGIDIQDGHYAAGYISKWGLDCELTKSHVKRGNGDGLTPFDLLRVSAGLLACDWMDCDAAGRTFQDFAEAFFGRHQLCWSRGLRQMLGLGQEKTDEELAQEKTEDASVIAIIDDFDWRRVRRYDMRAAVLIAAEEGGAAEVERLLRDLETFDSRKPQYRAWRN